MSVRPLRDVCGICRSDPNEKRIQPCLHLLCTGCASMLALAAARPSISLSCPFCGGGIESLADMATRPEPSIEPMDVGEPADLSAAARACRSVQAAVSTLSHSQAQALLLELSRASPEIEALVRAHAGSTNLRTPSSAPAPHGAGCAMHGPIGAAAGAARAGSRTAAEAVAEAAGARAHKRRADVPMGGRSGHGADSDEEGGSEMESDDEEEDTIPAEGASSVTDKQKGRWARHGRRQRQRRRERTHQPQRGAMAPAADAA